MKSWALQTGALLYCVALMDKCPKHLFVPRPKLTLRNLRTHGSESRGGFCPARRRSLPLVGSVRVFDFHLFRKPPLHREDPF